MSLLNKVKAKPVTVVKQEPIPAPTPVTTEADHKARKPVALMIGEIEEGVEIETIERGSIYDFRLDELNEKQSRFIALPDGIEFGTLKAAVRNHADKERSRRNDRQNFILRDAEKEINGELVQGIRVHCVSILDKPKRKTNKTQETHTQAA